MKTPRWCHLDFLLDLGDDGVDGEENIWGDASDSVRRTAYTSHSSLSFIDQCDNQEKVVQRDIRW